MVEKFNKTPVTFVTEAWEHYWVRDFRNARNFSSVAVTVFVAGTPTCTLPDIIPLLRRNFCLRKKCRVGYRVLQQVCGRIRDLCNMYWAIIALV